MMLMRRSPSSRRHVECLQDAKDAAVSVVAVGDILIWLQDYGGSARWRPRCIV